VLGARDGVVLLAAAIVFTVAAPATAGVGEGENMASGPLGAVYPGLEVEGWIGASDGSRSSDAAGARFVSGPVEEVAAVLGESGSTWADRPYLMAADSASSVGASAWHRSGRTGDGITIAVVDLGFTGYGSLLGTALPRTVDAVSFRSDGLIDGATSHGTAAAEIVHDVAPGADLVLVAFDGDLFRVIQYLIDRGVDIVSFAVGYLSGPFDGSTPASRAVAWAVEAGIIWVTAAGNFADSHWGGGPADGDGDGWVEFSGGDEINEFTVGPGAEFHLYLSWVGGGDLDLCLYEMPASVGAPIACASGTQGHGDRGLEVSRWRNTSSATVRFGYAIRVRSGAPVHADVTGWHIDGLEHGRAGGSVISPGDAQAAVTVGSVWWSRPGTVMVSSGRGPTADGRSKPDLVAPTGLDTRSWGSYGGTSGATPHVAGVAALLLEAYPGTPADGMADVLAARAQPIDGASGAGLVAAGPRTRACAGLAPTLTGTRGADRIRGTDGADVIHGRGGDDVIIGGRGADIICGGTGDDVVYGNAGADRLMGNAGADTLYGGNGRDRVLGGTGGDLAAGGGDGDVVSGGPGADRVYGDNGGDRVLGGPGDDLVSGGSGGDVVKGGPASTLRGERS